MKKIHLAKKDYIYLSVITVLLAVAVALGVVIAFQKNKEESIYSYYNMKCDAFKVDNINASHNQIVFIGDSITDGYRLDDYYGELSLATYNRGIGGDTTDGVLRRLDVSLFDINPSKIVLMIGTNDISGGRSNDEILNNYREILSEIKERLPETEVYCMSIIPQNSLFVSESAELEKRTEIIIEVNREIKELSERMGYQYVNIFDGLSENNILKAEYTEDGLHLNHKGYIVWTEILKPLLA